MKKSILTLAIIFMAFVVPFAKAADTTLNDITLASDIAGKYSLIYSGTVGDPIILHGGGHTVQCLSITGNYIEVEGVNVVGCYGHSIFVRAHDIKVHHSTVRNSVTKNGITACGTNGSWDSALKSETGSYNIEFSDNIIERNCGEGIGITMTHDFLVTRNTVIDNYSVDIYVDNSYNGIVSNNTTAYTGNSAYYRNGKVGKCILLGAENYASYGWTNKVDNISISSNSLSNCEGIGYYNPTNTTATNIVVANNNFLNVKLPVISIPGALIVYGTVTPATPTPTATQTVTKTITPTKTATPTITPTPTSTMTVTPTKTSTATPPTSPDGCFFDMIIKVCYWIE